MTAKSKCERLPAGKSTSAEKLPLYRPSARGIPINRDVPSSSVYQHTSYRTSSEETLRSQYMLNPRETTRNPALSAAEFVTVEI
jgi:hypothetical protein